MKIEIKLILLLICCSISLSALAQTPDSVQLKKIAAWIDKQDKKIFRFGFSIGMRTGFKSETESRTAATIRPDSPYVVNIEHIDMMDFLLSSSLTVFPFNKECSWSNFGFTANINLIELADAEVGTVFNKSIDGGFGFAYACDKDRHFAIAITYERTSTRRPKNWVIENEGKPIIVNGEAIREIDKNDDTYYIDTGLNAWSIKFIYQFK